MHALYAKDFNNDEAELLEEYIRSLIPKSCLALDATTQFMPSGFTILLTPFGYYGHTSTWMISWCVDNPTSIDTGLDNPPSLTDPYFELHMINHLSKIAMIIIQLCRCTNCNALCDQLRLDN